MQSILSPGPIGVFDSGYGGLTILSEFRHLMPEYDYLYLGDNARAPYGQRSFDIVYKFTLEAVKELFNRGCNLIILACNTASAKALRTIQQNDLPLLEPGKRVLGVIFPTVEAIDSLSLSRHVGLLATPGTVASHSYKIETAKLCPDISISELACPMWVPLVENGEAEGPGADYFVKKYLDIIMEKDPRIDTLLLGCTHYPLLMPKIKRYAPPTVRIVPQGTIVAESLKHYLLRHPEMEKICAKNGFTEYLTTENPEKFATFASLALHEEIHASKVTL